MGRVGLEPTRHHCRRILSPLRLPIPPPPRVRENYFTSKPQSFKTERIINHVFFHGFSRPSPISALALKCSSGETSLPSITAVFNASRSSSGELNSGRLTAPNPNSTSECASDPAIMGLLLSSANSRARRLMLLCQAARVENLQRVHERQDLQQVRHAPAVAPQVKNMRDGNKSALIL